MKTEIRRGRPRKFDEERTLDQIMQVFWKNGYSATSLDQIAAATGLNRPSLYAAFGSKKDMYLRTIDRFAEQMEGHLRRAGQQAEGVSPRLKAIMAASIDMYTGQTEFCDQPYGCLAISTLPAEAAQDPDLKAILSTLTKRMDTGFARLIHHETRDLKPTPPAEEIAEHLALLLHGLSVRARAGEDPEDLKKLANKAVDLLLPYGLTF